MKSLKSTLIFVEIARVRNISEAARNMGITPAAASQAVKRLETELGLTLFKRTTRHLTLTDQGEIYLPYCLKALNILSEGQNLALGASNELHGSIKISMPSDTGRNVLYPLLNEFLQLHPRLELVLNLSDELKSVHSNSIDLALRFGQLTDSSLIAIPISNVNRRVLCVSPAYIEQFGPINTPDEIIKHNCLCYSVRDSIFNTWSMENIQTGEVKELKVTGNRLASDGSIVKQWALDGFGVAFKSFVDVESDIEKGTLIHICKDWASKIVPLNLIFSKEVAKNANTTALKEFLIAKLR